MTNLDTNLKTKNYLYKTYVSNIYTNNIIFREFEIVEPHSLTYLSDCVGINIHFSVLENVIRKKTT